MTIDKSARLEAIRAKNRATSAPVPSHPPPSPTATTVAGDPFISVGMRIVLGLFLLTVGGLLVRAVVEIWMPIVGHTLPSLEQDQALALSRASALVSFMLVWGSMALGLAITGRAVRIWPGGPAALDLHQHLGLLGLAFAILHLVFLISAPGLGYTPLAALSPFSGSSYRPMWMGVVGKSALYLMMLVGLSFVVKSRIGPRWWRRIHYLSFAVYITTVVHGVAAGSDTPKAWALTLYGLCSATLAGLTVYRIIRVRQARRDMPIVAGTLVFHPSTRMVKRRDGVSAQLSRFEARLLQFLLAHQGQDLSIDEVLEGVWGKHFRGEQALVHAYVRRLSMHLEGEHAGARLVVTAHDSGDRIQLTA